MTNKTLAAIEGRQAEMQGFCDAGALVVLTQECAESFSLKLNDSIGHQLRACLQRLRPAVEDGIGCRVAALAAGAAEGRERGEQIQCSQRRLSCARHEAPCAVHLARELCAHAGCCDVANHSRVQHGTRMQHSLQRNDTHYDFLHKIPKLAVMSALQKNV